jgi:hypothetical protein
MTSTITSLLLPIGSVLALTLLAWLASRTTRVAVCPICAGVSGTWLWMLAAKAGGFAVDPVMLAILLGASVVGGAQLIDTRLPPGRSGLLWKALALPTGFTVAYGLTTQQWALASVAAAVVASMAALFLRPRNTAADDPAAVAKLEEQMKKCC